MAKHRIWDRLIAVNQSNKIQHVPLNHSAIYEYCNDLVKRSCGFVSLPCQIGGNLSSKKQGYEMEQFKSKTTQKKTWVTPELRQLTEEEALHLANRIKANKVKNCK